jgi:hypothetical protein
MADVYHKEQSMEWQPRSGPEHQKDWRVVRDVLRGRRSGTEELCVHPNLTAGGPDEVSCGADRRRAFRRGLRNDRSFSR